MGAFEETMAMMRDAEKRFTNNYFKKVMHDERIKLSTLLDEVKNGRLVIPHNNNRNTKPVAIGNAVSTKTNMVVGTSLNIKDAPLELKKAKTAEKYGVDMITDANSKENITQFRKQLMKTTNLPIATLPLLEAATTARLRDGSTKYITEEDILQTTDKQLKEGSDMLTIHASFTQELLPLLNESERILPVDTAAGAYIATYMLINNVENPFYTNFDYILEQLQEYDATIGLASVLRPSCVVDSTDVLQLKENIILSRLIRRAQEAKIQTISGGQGYVQLNLIESNLFAKESINQETPIFISGPMVTDIVPGYDDMVSAIGATIAAMTGANLIRCCPANNTLNESPLDKTRKAVISARLAAHIADLNTGKPRHMDLEKRMAEAKRDNNIERQKEIALDPLAADISLQENTRKLGCGRCKETCSIQYFNEKITKKI